MFAVGSSESPLHILWRRNRKERRLAIPPARDQPEIKPQQGPRDCNVFQQPPSKTRPAIPLEVIRRPCLCLDGSEVLLAIPASGRKSAAALDLYRGYLVSPVSEPVAPDLCKIRDVTVNNHTGAAKTAVAINNNRGAPEHPN